MTLEQIRKTATHIREKTNGFEPEVGIILGSGLGSLADRIDVAYTLNYSEITGFPVSTVEGHAGQFIFGRLGGRRVVAMQGRFHYYEGYAPTEVVLPVRVMGLLGIRFLFVSNAAGGVNPSFAVGDLMVITDHINLIPNPLVGRNIDELGPRFPDMSDAYDVALVELAGRLDAGLRYGVYVGGTGPTFETTAEYRYFQTIGGDAVGMSTTPEVIAARHMGIPVFGMSVITNVGLSGVKSTHEEVQAEGAKAAARMTRLFVEMIEKL
ncbi:MAG: purine-nucleoside phosphorylase [Rikenellaceae bacterium]|nr:purine-nucleoside phosphorylase [Rikenellaceae bacterium]MCL2692579.1 purine-nucleoside phosphorylase [Rikenellaceae bacterium]